MAFDPTKHIIRVKGGREYLPVSARLVWFRLEHADWGIVTEAVTMDLERQMAVFRATIFDETGRIMATATKMETARDFPDFLEKAETGSVGRALAMCGYGTQFAPEFEEVREENGNLGNNRFVDAPQSLTPSNERRPMPGNTSREPMGDTRHAGNSNRPNMPNTTVQNLGTARTVPTGAAITRVREPITNDNLDPGGDFEDEDESALENLETVPVMAQNRVPMPPQMGKDDDMAITKVKCSAEGCPAVLTQSQITISTTKFGKPLCPLHQRDAVPLAARP